jgi:hypothetical protein
MALNNRRGRVWSRFHLLLRFAGLTGLMVAGVGAVLASVDVQPLGRYLLYGGGGVAVLGLLVELIGALSLLTGQRGQVGFNALVQIILATVLLAGANVYSFRHYLRYDLTRNHQFTIDAETRQQLAQLRGETTIVVYQRHKTFGDLSDKPDRFDIAAERKVVEKVYDLVEQVREFGPQFRVVVLDVEEEGYDDKLNDLTKNAPELRKAIDTAPENSIFFLASRDSESKPTIQRLSFNAFYQLDKTASRDDNDKHGNLVLRHQDRGVQPFARRVLNIDAKRPKVAVLTIHEALSTRQGEIIGLKGMAKTLATNGFDVVDIILKKFTGMGGPEAVVYTYDENKFDILEEELASNKDDLKDVDEALAADRARHDKLKSGDDKALEDTLTDMELSNLLSKGMLVAREQLQGEVGKALKKMDDARKKAFQTRAAEFVALQVGALEEEQKKLQQERDKTAQDREALSVESLTELRRMSDLTAKLNRLLADCDLVIVPRFTIYTVMPPQNISNDLHLLGAAQTAALKQFMGNGKPVLACFGPPNDARPQMAPPSGNPAEDVEALLGQLNVKFAKFAVLHRAEAKTFVGAQDDFSLPRTTVDVPPVEFDWEALTSVGLDLKEEKTASPKKPNPIRESLRIASRSIGKNLDLQVRYARPVFYDSKNLSSLPFDPYIMQSSKETWNEDRPFPSRQYRPRPPKENEARGTLDRKGVGPFPLGVAIEADVPADWHESKDAKATKVRVVALGHGGLFAGNDVAPAKEKLLLDSCNWLLSRDDLLARENDQGSDKGIWKYPRLTTLPGRDLELWHWGTQLGIPALFGYLGMVVLMVRRLR